VHRFIDQLVGYKRVAGAAVFQLVADPAAHVARFVAPPVIVAEDDPWC
jgi:hypothetical protein